MSELPKNYKKGEEEAKQQLTALSDEEIDSGADEKVDLTHLEDSSSASDELEEKTIVKAIISDSSATLERDIRQALYECAAKNKPTPKKETTIATAVDATVTEKKEEEKRASTDEEEDEDEEEEDEETGKHTPPIEDEEETPEKSDADEDDEDDESFTVKSNGNGGPPLAKKPKVSDDADDSSHSVQSPDSTQETDNGEKDSE